MSRYEELLEKYGLKEKDIADYFGLSLQSFRGSSAKLRYINAFVLIVDRVEEKIKEKTFKIEI